MEIKYSRKEFDGYTHRFIVKFSIDDDWRNDSNIHIYSNSDSYIELEKFITEKKGEKVKSFKIEYRATKEADEANAKWLMS